MELHDFGNPSTAVSGLGAMVCAIPQIGFAQFRNGASANKNAQGLSERRIATLHRAQLFSERSYPRSRTAAKTRRLPQCLVDLAFGKQGCTISKIARRQFLDRFAKSCTTSEFVKRQLLDPNKTINTMSKPCVFASFLFGLEQSGRNSIPDCYIFEIAAQTTPSGPRRPTNLHFRIHATRLQSCKRFRILRTRPSVVFINPRSVAMQDGHPLQPNFPSRCLIRA